MKTATTATAVEAATARVATASSAVLGDGCLRRENEEREGCNACEKSFVFHYSYLHKRVGPGGRKAHLQANPTPFGILFCMGSCPRAGAGDRRNIDLGMVVCYTNMTRLVVAVTGVLDLAIQPPLAAMQNAAMQNAARHEKTSRGGE